MKMKSFAMLLVSGVLFSSGAYIAPAIADDEDSSGQSMMMAENDMSSNINTNIASNDAADPAASNDQGAPDTATGDDDY